MLRMQAHAGIPLAAYYTTNSFPATKIMNHFQGSNSYLNLPSYKTMYMTLM